MREIEVSKIPDVVEKLCIEANEHLPEDVKCAIKDCRACEDGEIAKGVLDNIIENFEIADKECVPICQDTGMACVFLEIIRIWLIFSLPNPFGPTVTLICSPGTISV